MSPRPIHFESSRTSTRISAACGFESADGRRFTRSDTKPTCRVCLARLDESATPGGREIPGGEYSEQLRWYGPMEQDLEETFSLRALTLGQVIEIATDRGRLLRKMIEAHPEHRAEFDDIEWSRSYMLGVAEECCAAGTPPDAQESAAPGTVNYAIQSERGGPIKLGLATDPQRRLSHLQTSHHEPLVILATWPGDGASEAAAHERWRHLRIRGEWFDPSEDLLAWIHEQKAGI